VSELDSQASAIKHTRTSTESSLSGPSIHSDRRQRQCCLCSCLQRGAREVHRFHAQLSWRARARTTLDPRLLRARRTIRRRIAPRGVCLSSRVGAHRQCNCRPQLGMLFTSVLNGCLPSWPNFVSVHSLSLLPFSPFALKHRERKTEYLRDATQRRSQTNTCSASRRGCAAFDHLNRRSKASGSNCSRDSTTTSA
jgi:hypothetical protein